MPGAVWTPRQSVARPGAYVRGINIGLDPTPTEPDGIAAALISASWGPLGVATPIASLVDIDVNFGTGTGADALTQLIYGGAASVQAVRVGTGGVVATYTLMDTTPTTPVSVVRIDAKYPGSRGNNLKLTIQAHPTDTTLKQLIVTESGTQRQLIQFAAGAGEDAAVVAAVNGTDGTNQPSAWIVATHLAAGNGILASITSTALSAGTNPTVASGDYTTGMSVLEPQAVVWNALVVDIDASSGSGASVQLAAQSFVDRIRNDGKRVLLVVGDPTSIAFSARLTSAKAFNDPAVVYVANGFVDNAGATVDGFRAAARVAGMILAVPYNESITHRQVTGAVKLSESHSFSDIVDAINAGAVLLTLGGDPSAQVIEIEYGITTLVSLSGQQDSGLKKIRRVRERDKLADLLALAAGNLVGRVNNNPTGRALVIGAMQSVVNDFVSDNALLPGAKVIEDPANQAVGDSAWFRVDFDDVDSMEKAFLTLGTRFTAPS